MTPTQRAHYLACIAEGTTPKLAEMLALRQPPGCHGDEIRGVGTLEQQLGPDAERVAQAAARQGFNVGANDLYNPTLADRPGDPKAFFSQSDGWSSVRKRCKEIENRPPKKPVRLAEKIVQREMKYALKMYPEKRSNLPKLREEIIERHAVKT